MKKTLLVVIVLLGFFSSNAQQKDSTYLKKEGSVMVKYTLIKDTLLTGIGTSTLEEAKKILQTGSSVTTVWVFKPNMFPLGLFWIRKIPEITKKSLAFSSDNNTPYIYPENSVGVEQRVPNTYVIYLFMWMLVAFFLRWLAVRLEYKTHGHVEYAPCVPTRIIFFLIFSIVILAALFVDNLFGYNLYNWVSWEYLPSFISDTITILILYSILTHFLMKWLKKKYPAESQALKPYRRRGF